MADVTFEGDSDFERVKRDFDRLHRDMVKLREENKKLNDESRRAAQQNKEQEDARQKSLRESKELWSDVTRGLSDHASSLLTVHGAVNLVWQGVDLAIGKYREWKAEQRALSEASLEFTAQLSKQLQLSGQLQNADQVNAWARNRPDATREEALAAFQGVAAAAPTVGVNRQLDIAAAAARAAPITGDPQLTGRLAGQLATTLPSGGQRSGAELVNLASRMQQIAGGDREKLMSAGYLQAVQKLTAQGVDENTALALGLNAMQNNTNAGVLDQVAQQLRGRPERLQRVLQSRLPGMAADARLLDMADVNRMALQLDAAASDDAVGNDLARLRESRTGSRVLDNRERERLKQQNRSDDAIFAAQKKFLDDMMLASNEGWYDAWQARADLENTQDEMSLAAKLGNQTAIDYLRDLRSDPSALVRSVAPGSTRIEDEQADRFRDAYGSDALVNELREQNRQTRQILDEIRNSRPVVVPAGPPER